MVKALLRLRDWQASPLYDAAVLLVALLTNLLLWFNYEQTLRVASLRRLWLSEHHPAGGFDALLSLWGAAMQPSVALMMILNSLSLWLFVRIALSVGIGRITAFLLFLLVNFNPELNEMRFSIRAEQVAMFLWLLGMWGFLANYRSRFYLAFLLWAGFLWLSVLFQPLAVVWALGFPLCFLFWPGSGGWRRKLWERGRFLLGYYALVAILFSLSGGWQHINWAVMNERFSQARAEMSLLVGGDSHYMLSVDSAFAIALVLVVIKGLKVTGFLILFFVWLSTRRKVQSVLLGRVRLFLVFCLLFNIFIGALSLLLHGRLPEDLEYMPMVMMLLLWLGAPSVFYTYNRVREGRVAPERVLIAGWLLVAYALATLVHFGPTAGYLREAGEWARTQQYQRIFSNMGEVLYFSGANPLAHSPDFLDIGVPGTGFYRIGKDDLLMHMQNRNLSLPPDFDAFEVLQTFANRRGDKVYALRLKNAP